MRCSPGFPATTTRIRQRLRSTTPCAPRSTNTRTYRCTASPPRVRPATSVLLTHSATADLLVLGAPRRQGQLSRPLGRVAHAALQHADCPVAVVPRRGNGAPLV
ncbi:universal stress protein [Streptomyces caelestis]|uniref:universal stress protein n=1 Tax=Streptomyces caelestis TaxID=36816 RepID=UPI003830DF68